MCNVDIRPTCPICKDKILAGDMTGISADKTKYHYSCLIDEGRKENGVI